MCLLTEHAQRIPPLVFVFVASLQRPGRMPHTQETCLLSTVVMKIKLATVVVSILFISAVIFLRSTLTLQGRGFSPAPSLAESSVFAQNSPVIGWRPVIRQTEIFSAYYRVRNMKNRLSKNSSMKIPVHYTCRGKLKTKIVAHKILPLKSYSSLKSTQSVISIIFLYLTEKQPSEILRLLLEIQTRWFDVCCTVKY